MNRAVWMGVFLVGISIFAQSTNSPNDPTADRARVLSVSGRINFGIPMFGSVGKTDCDTSGSMYFNVGTRIGQMGPFLSVSSDGRNHVVYALPPELSAFADLAWAVAPGGTLYILRGNSNGYKLIRFKGDGSIGGISSFDIPARTTVRFFAIAENGTVYVQGYRATQDPLTKPSPGFAGLFDASGKLVHDLSENAPQVDLSAAQFGPLDGDAVAGEDGRFYLLDARKVLVLNQAGEVERELKFQKPLQAARAVRVDYSKGVLSIIFHSVNRISPSQPADVEVRALLLNAQTGEPQGNFVFDPTSTSSVICFNIQDGYSLMAMDGKMAAKDIVPIR